MNKEKAKELEERTKRYTVSIYKLISMIPNNPNANALKNQLFRSASSIGANYREANRSKSKIDFKYKIRICEGEASETFYWMEVLKDLDLIKGSSFNSCLKETNEILAIFTSISATIRAKEKEQLRKQNQ